MPAAELPRLHAQINELIARFDDPVRLRNGLRDLLDLYSNRAYRPGQAVRPQPLLPSYRVPPLIMRQLELEFSKACQEQPEQALLVVDQLWHDPYLEPHLLAAYLIGTIPASQESGIMSLLRAWAQPTENFRILETLFQLGTVTLRRTRPEPLLALFEEWLTGVKTDQRALGIRALIPLIQDPQFENIPPIFRMLSPLIQTAPSNLHVDLQSAIEALAKRTPTETVFFLRQTLSLAASPNTARLIRRCLPSFDAAQQASLRKALSASSSL